MSATPKLSEFLADSVSRIERHLDGVPPPADTAPAVLHDAMRYALAGGKRLRSALAFGAAIASGREPDVALPAAAAVELVHAYSLVHDDLPCMDDDAERRGQPTVHVKYGEANAVMAGDALLTLAFAQLAPTAHPAALVERLAHAAGSMNLVGGQVDDLAAAGGAKLAEITSIHLRKTAALFRFSVFGGGILAGLGEPELDHLDDFARAYGLGFQAVDDLLDQGTDELSILGVLSPAEARAYAEHQIAEALGALEPFESRGWALRGVAEALTGRLP